MYNAKIASTGSAFPDNVVTNLDLEKIVDTSDEWIRERTGIKERRCVREGENNSDLGAKAAQQALKKADIAASEIDMIIYCTNSADKLLPATACIVQAKIGAHNAVAFDLVAACAGWVLGLSVADQYIRSGAAKNIMVIGAETLSRILNWKDRNTCVLFGDGAGASLVQRANSGETSAIITTQMKSDGRHESILDIKAGGTALPVTAELIEQGAHYISMKGKEVFKLAVRAMAERAEECCREANVDMQDIDWIIPHQANIRIIEAICKKMDIPQEKVIVNLDKFGNTSAATIPTALDGAIEAGKIKRGQLVLFTTFGGGLTSAASLVRL